MTPTERAMRASPFLLLISLCLPLPACSGPQDEGEQETITRAVFVDAYVDLRLKAVREEGARTPQERERLLERHGIEPEDLLHFVEVHGRDVEFMSELWLEIDQKVNEPTAAAGEAPTG